MKYLKSLLQQSNTYISGKNKILSRLTHSGLLSDDVNKNFHISLPKIIHDVIHAKKYKNVSGVEDKIEKAIKYNWRTENQIGGETLLHAYTTLEEADNVCSYSFQQAFVFAWAVETVHSHSLMMDDTRALKSPGEDLTDDVTGANADLLRSFMQVMLEYHFGSSRRYNDFLKLYNKAFIYNALAREIADRNSKSISNFNEELYDQICEYKTYTPLTLPLLMALKLANRTDEKMYNAVESISSEMGQLYQMKKDFHNCFGREETIGTEGTDIQRNRCTWLSTAALQRFTPRQRVVFAACYGCDQPAHIERVKVLYQDLRLPELYKQRQAAMRAGITEKAEGLEKRGVPSDVLLRILDKIVDENNVFGNEKAQWEE